MKLWNRMGASLAISALAVVAFGQTTTPPTTTTPTTCTTAPTSLTALNFERVIPLADFLSTLTPNAPASLLGAIEGGALEIHEILIYNPQLATITSTVFTEAAGSPVPTPNFNFSTGVIQVTTFQIVGALFGCNPVPSLLVGAWASATSGVYGSFSNSPAGISIGYTTDTPAAINNVAEVIAGVAVAWSAGGTGTLTVYTPPVSGGGTTTGTGPTIVVKAANGTIAIPNSTVQVGSSPFLLDASGSTGNGALTFAWKTTSNSPVAFVHTGTPGQILVQFPGPGDYAILLTVTDSTGATATFAITLEFTGRPD
jgi:hypothetical protein